MPPEFCKLWLLVDWRAVVGRRLLPGSLPLLCHPAPARLWLHGLWPMETPGTDLSLPELMIMPALKVRAVSAQMFAMLALLAKRAACLLHPRLPACV